ncbi:RNA polymerase sigma factor [Chitinophaga sp. MD30]|uniref:RNA polymerase sigma factor n=1 Tax=Chitinophaga sp. MD30 TaxID=2033437 RepID=UPI000BAE8208|nr:RNA polymerase sigma-70 factor [Chitinophaga sp. MD30]ASZ09517.1 RNA polymerase sigma-70 factor [Chitinophaga sp. MD30]
MDPLVQQYVSKIREGDATAFRDLFYAFKDPLYGYARKMCRSDMLAEEIVQEVLMKVWINRQHLDPAQSIKAYLYTATQNCVFNWMKKSARDETLKRTVFYHQPLSSNITEEHISLGELQRLKSAIMEQLPPQRRLIFYMSRIEGLSHEEIATRLQLSKSTVKDQIVKANSFLRQKLQGHHDIIIPLLIITTSPLLRELHF